MEFVIDEYFVVVQWLVDNKIRRLFTAYIFTVSMAQ